jgi:hypothetical protein
VKKRKKRKMLGLVDLICHSWLFLIKNKKPAGHQWLMLVILATQGGRETHHIKGQVDWFKV